LHRRLKTVHLEWATFQVMRRMHATRSRQVGIDPKLVADQLGHGVGVHLMSIRSPHWINASTLSRRWSYRFSQGDSTPNKPFMDPLGLTSIFPRCSR
jgi:hypothetical protein